MSPVPQAGQSHADQTAQSVYDRIAPAYDDRWARHMREPQDRLTRGLRLVPGARCADLGCGTGIDTIEMLKQVAPGEVVGVDCSEEMLRAAERRAADERLSLATLCTDAESFIHSAEPRSFDVVTLRFCLAYLDWRSSLARVAPALRPGGRLGILTNLATSAPQAYALYCRMADELGLQKATLPVPESVEQMSDLLHRAGLHVEESWTYRFRLWFATGAELADWLQETGFVTHPALFELAPEVLAPLVALFAHRIEAEHRTPRGTPLDFELAGVIAVAP